MHNKTNLRIIGVAALLAFSAPLFAQQKTLEKSKSKSVSKTSQAESIPKDPNVKIGKLANGLTYYIRKNSLPSKRAELYLVNKVGSLMEEDSQQGLAHFTEHMAFNGTRDFPKNEIIDYLQKAGVRFGADLNAYTGFDRTVYQLPIPTDSTQVFKTGFKILSNWAGGISMESEEIDNERGVIIEEDRQRGRNAQERINKQLYPVLLKGARHQNRLPIGKADILQHFTHDKIRNFYNDWYRPNLQAVIAVGDFDVTEVEKLIKANFSALKNPVNPKPYQHYDLPDNTLPMVKVITDPEQTSNLATLMYKHRSSISKNTKDLKRNLAYSMINSMMRARFQEIMQRADAPFLSAQSSYGPYQGGLVEGISAFQTSVSSKNGASLGKALSSALSENERMAKFGFLSSEMNVVKKNIIAGNQTQTKEIDKTPSASLVQFYLGHFLSGSPMPSLDYLYAQQLKAINEITLQEINDLAKMLITKENRILIVRAPEKEKANLPSQAELLGIMDGAGKDLSAYVDNLVNKPLLEQTPLAGKIISERNLSSVDATELTLSNGIKVLLKKTDFKNDQVIFSSYSKGGTSLAQDKEFTSSKVVGLIPQSGVGEFNPTQLSRLLAGNSGRAGAYINELYQGFSGGASPKDLETAFQMVYAYALNPRKDPEQFNKKIGEARIALTNKTLDPKSVFSDTAQAVLSNYHKRAMPFTLSDLDQVSIDETYDFYKSRFADLGEQVFVIVGAIDATAIKPLIEKYIASLPTKEIKQDFVDLGIRPPKGRVRKVVYKGLEDKASVELLIHGSYDFNPSTNIQLDALKSALENKIMQRLREKESGVYTPSVGLVLKNQPNEHYYFMISFSCAPEKVEKLIEAALDEVRSVKTSGASQDEIIKFKSEQQRRKELNLLQNNYWLNYLTTQLKNGAALDQYLGDKKRLDDVSVESTKTTAQSYLSEDNYIELILLPEKSRQVQPPAGK